MLRQIAPVLAAVAVCLGAVPLWAQSSEDAARVDLRIAQQIPLRDGVTLSGNLYLPRGEAAPAPCIVSLTPYTAQTYHDRGVYFAARGMPFLIVDVRGRGNSQGTFRPLIQEARDGHDVVEWLGRQPYCNGKVGMWGGSYAGYNQWAAASERPPHLATIVPVASPYAGVDFPSRRNIPQPYPMQWRNFVAGRTLQPAIFGDQAFWSQLWRRRFEQGVAFDTLPTVLGGDDAAMREWIAHPELDAYWDSYNPTAAQYGALSIPILTITGSYDGDQPGAIRHYRDHMAAAPPEERARHFLIIGPWDHAGTRTPTEEVGGVKFGPASLIDLPALHAEWYRWTMADGPRPEFLKDRVAYYVIGANQWRYSPTLEAVTARMQPYFLDSQVNATEVGRSGTLLTEGAGSGRPDSYRYDPRDTANAALEAETGESALTDQRAILANDGRQLVYHTPPFDRDTDIAGSFRLTAWIAIDQPDTDFRARVYEIDNGGRSTLLSTDLIRARYRTNPREAKLVTTTAPLRYDFDQFTFMARRIASGSRLRLVIDPINSIFYQKNYNSGKAVASETMTDARIVTVRMFHDRKHPSALYVPIERQN